jgi:hypothetical protein
MDNPSFARDPWRERFCFHDYLWLARGKPAARADRMGLTDEWSASVGVLVGREATLRRRLPKLAKAPVQAQTSGKDAQQRKTIA